MAELVEEQEPELTAVYDLGNGFSRLHEYRVENGSLRVEYDHLKGFESCAYGSSDSEEEVRERAENLDIEVNETDVAPVYRFDEIVKDVLVE
jgi:hypothetical protein